MYWQDSSQAQYQYNTFYPTFQAPTHQHASPPQQSAASPALATIDTTIRNGSKKRRACNECKQQKLRCDLSALINPSAHCCSRCKRLGLECRIDRSFRRERKRKRSDELEKEVDILKEELSKRAQSAQASNGEQPSEPGHFDLVGPSESDGVDTRSLHHLDIHDDMLLTPHPIMTSPISASGSEHGTPFTSLTANPGLPAPQGSRTLERVQLNSMEINYLFAAYFTHYHPFLPILDVSLSPALCFENSSLLFWAVISVASRRRGDGAALYLRLSGPVTALAWKSLQSLPHRIHDIQALALLCTWPFPIDDSRVDVSYLWAGAMMQMGVQLGLHRPLTPQDFSKDRIQLTKADVSEMIRTWAACNIVAQRVSIGNGLPAPVQYDWALISRSTNGHATMRLDPTLEIQLRTNMFREHVSRSMSSVTDPAGLLPTHGRLPLYKDLADELHSIEAFTNTSSSFYHFSILAARLHLESYYLFDEPSSESYVERILMLYFTASSLVQHTLDMERDMQGFIQYCPYATVQVFIAAAFIMLKILRNDYFASFVDAGPGRDVFCAALNAIRSLSIAPNDLPSRFANVLQFLSLEVPSHVIAGYGKDGLRLAIRSRDSMSVVFDSLWRWREQGACSAIKQQLGLRIDA
ncbi:hypothetical protein K491DRAFT_706146 [Lophiostoma macrostomum CBS 122681]|uniref:Zn(2)-C6 fungal-type domain-containing protein n=1 Tax=Lophiostoma macrostomum CBS 122681 TaxID=1314788 RepID=A0A6A6T319_9PLEO|nr:hypothetical protein K491DRAFT_706146 [Lophiostoma macrostomum CBS 122681]